MAVIKRKAKTNLMRFMEKDKTRLFRNVLRRGNGAERKMVLLPERNKRGAC